MKKTSRFIGLLCILTILVGSFAGMSAFAAAANSDFTIVKGVLTKYNGSDDSVTIPNGVTGIGEGAFKSCEELTNVAIPKSVTSIGFNAFRGCLGLTKVTIPSSVVSIGNGAFANCKNITNINIPNSVTNIGESTFEGCAGLTNITIPNSVINIGDRAFGNCVQLTNVTIPSSVVSIGNQAFISCMSLTQIVIPKSVTSIEQGTFEFCTALTNITIPNSVTSIGRAAFSSCSELTNVTLSSSITSIGDSVFRDCKKLIDITIPSSVAKIDNSAFNGCTSLASMDVESDNKNYSSIDGVLFDKSKQVLLCYPEGREEQVYAVPNNATFLEDNSFARCTKLLSVIIPRSVTQIGAYAFSGTTATIYGYENTAAQNYAKNNRIPFHALDSLSATNSTVVIGAAEASTVNGTALFFVAFLVCAAIFAVCVVIWNKKRREEKESVQTAPLPSSLSQAETDVNSKTECEPEAEPKNPEPLEIICSRCGHSCMANTEICPTCGRKLTK